ncbi:PREDICTED: non-specific lipid-transfer protein 2P-like [Camelina sativa]|uniref:Non-specific lipid-transfer protein 2P-like n=1 Tax=Camelina sativa TaxID=90675 RepID=A0ABM1QW30_CAMSA|nr:PREDICTED: non-specific lipid-transfer protein 2P-like [Camelina sativa]
MMMKFITLVFIAFVISTLAPTKAEEKAACAVTDLIPCLSALQGWSSPSTECCMILKDKQSCFCDYLKDPRIGGPYLSAAKNILVACNVPIPTC